jgi:hypothetical protein
MVRQIGHDLLHARLDRLAGSQIRIFFRLAFSTFEGYGPTKVIEPMNLFFLSSVGFFVGREIFTKSSFRNAARKT